MVQCSHILCSGIFTSNQHHGFYRSVACYFWFKTFEFLEIPVCPPHAQNSCVVKHSKFSYCLSVSVSFQKKKKNQTEISWGWKEDFNCVEKGTGSYR